MHAWDKSVFEKRFIQAMEMLLSQNVLLWSRDAAGKETGTAMNTSDVHQPNLTEHSLDSLEEDAH